jgi:hypothetical protein
MIVFDTSATCPDMEHIEITRGETAKRIGPIAARILRQLGGDEALEALEQERTGKDGQRYAEADCDDGPRDHSELAV